MLQQQKMKKSYNCYWNNNKTDATGTRKETIITTSFNK